MQADDIRCSQQIRQGEAFYAVLCSLLFAERNLFIVIDFFNPESAQQTGCFPRNIAKSDQTDRAVGQLLQISVYNMAFFDIDLSPFADSPVTAAWKTVVL